MSNEILVLLIAVVILVVLIALVVILLKTLKASQVSSPIDISEGRKAELLHQLEDARNRTRELEGQQRQAELELAEAVRNAVEQKDEEIRAAEDRRKRAEYELESTRERAAAELQATVERSALELEALKTTTDAQLQAAYTRAAAEKEALRSEMSAQAVEERREIEKERDNALSDWREKQLEFDKQVSEYQAKIEGMENEYKVRMDELEKSKDMQIEDLETRLENARDMKSKLSVKLLGESLEQHCEMAFNQIRHAAFRNAEFGKDNEAIEGTKGDYIYREYDDDGVEIVSIMFEMKTESEDSTNTRTNESHLKKLDKDRTKKKCEYAVLVSMLEPDNEYYNGGIVDVSHLYPKMYVVRPQFFIPIISLLRNAALNSIEVRKKLNAVLKSQPDVAGFEEKLEKLKGEVAKSNDHANDKCESAIKGIDGMINKLNKIKSDIEMIQKYSNQSNQRMENITIRKLTYGNDGMKTRFDEARKAAPISAEVLSVENIKSETGAF